MNPRRRFRLKRLARIIRRLPRTLRGKWRRRRHPIRARFYIYDARNA